MIMEVLENIIDIYIELNQNFDGNLISEDTVNNYV